MNIHKIIRRRFRRVEDGLDVAGDVHAVVAANVGERGSSVTHVSSKQTVQQSTPPRRKED